MSYSCECGWRHAQKPCPAHAGKILKEASATVALDGDTRRCCNDPECGNDWPCALHPDGPSEPKAGPRKFPAEEKRVETGPIQFGDDWPGMFIRGDNAFGLVMAIQGALAGEPMSLAILKGWSKTLGECNMNTALNEYVQAGRAESAAPEPQSYIPVNNSLPRDHFPGGQNWNAEATPIKVEAAPEPKHTATGICGCWSCNPFSRPKDAPEPPKKSAQSEVIRCACGKDWQHQMTDKCSPPVGHPAEAALEPAEPEWRKLPIGAWFFDDSPSCTSRYSVQERTSGGCHIVCSTPYHYPQAKKNMEEIAGLHNEGVASKPGETTLEIEREIWRLRELSQQQKKYEAVMVLTSLQINLGFNTVVKP
jgi:hypothetical protein